MRWMGNQRNGFGCVPKRRGLHRRSTWEHIAFTGWLLPFSSLVNPLELDWLVLHRCLGQRLPSEGLRCRRRGALLHRRLLSTPGARRVSLRA